eukprot:Opistho-2@19483
MVVFFFRSTHGKQIGEVADVTKDNGNIIARLCNGFRGHQPVFIEFGGKQIPDEVLCALTHMAGMPHLHLQRMLHEKVKSHAKLHLPVVGDNSDRHEHHFDKNLGERVLVDVVVHHICNDKPHDHHRHAQGRPICTAEPEEVREVQHCDDRNLRRVIRRMRQARGCSPGCIHAGFSATTIAAIGDGEKRLKSDKTEGEAPQPLQGACMHNVVCCAHDERLFLVCVFCCRTSTYSLVNGGERLRGRDKKDAQEHKENDQKSRKHVGRLRKCDHLNRTNEQKHNDAHGYARHKHFHPTLFGNVPRLVFLLQLRIREEKEVLVDFRFEAHHNLVLLL